MNSFWKFIMGTVRAISLLAWAPPLVAAVLVGEFTHALISTCIGTMLAVGFANALNSLCDRRIDQLNPLKKTLAVSSPVAAFYIVLFLLPFVAWSLRTIPQNAVLLAALFYLSFWYAYALANIPILKRVIVAFCVATTTLLPAKQLTVSLGMLWLALFTFIFRRETRKDHDDRYEDEMARFRTFHHRRDWWCSTAPALALLAFLLCIFALRGTVESSDLIIACGLIISVWSYMQIRGSYKRYRQPLQRPLAGRLGIVVALVGLMPAFVSSQLLLVVWLNSASILYRSFQSRRLELTWFGRLHDAALWASLPFIALAKSNVWNASCAYLSLTIFLVVLSRETIRHRGLATA